MKRKFAMILVFLIMLVAIVPVAAFADGHVLDKSSIKENYNAEGTYRGVTTDGVPVNDLVLINGAYGDDQAIYFSPSKGTNYTMNTAGQRGTLSSILYNARKVVTFTLAGAFFAVLFAFIHKVWKLASSKDARMREEAKAGLGWTLFAAGLLGASSFIVGTAYNVFNEMF